MWSLWITRNKLTTEGRFPKTQSDVLLKPHTFLQKWRVLLEAADQSKLDEVMVEINAWLELFLEKLKDQAAWRELVSAAAVAGLLRLGSCVSFGRSFMYKLFWLMPSNQFCLLAENNTFVRLLAENSISFGIYLKGRLCVCHTTPIMIINLTHVYANEYPI